MNECYGCIWYKVEASICTHTHPNPYDSYEILYLLTKNEWLQMILAGVKREVYCKQSDFWREKLFNKDGSLKQFDYLCFYSDYKTAWYFKYNGLRIGVGIKKYGAPDEDVFILDIGDFIEKSSYTPPYQYCQRKNYGKKTNLR